MAKTVKKKPVPKKPAHRSVESLKKLLAQVNELAPNRSKVSDGWIGDVKHMARHSDHNPEPDGTVDARDFTNDPSGGCDARKLCQAILDSRDPRLSYVISNGEIASGQLGPKPWVWRKYTGSNSHHHHAHVSVLDEGQDDKSDWQIASAFKPVVKLPVVPPPPIIPQEQMPLALSYEAKKALQQQLVDLGYNEVGGIDGSIGSFTRAAIAAFRRDNGLPSGDRIDKQLVDAFKTAKPRVLDPKRENAPVAVVTAKIPEARAHWWNKWLGIGVAGSAGATGLIDAIAPARGVVDQVRDVATDVPGWAWLAIIAVIAVVIVVFANRGEKASVEAFRDGSRR